MEMAGPLVRHKLGWKHLKCRCTWDQQTHTGASQALVTHTATTATTAVLGNEEQVVFLSINFFGAARKHSKHGASRCVIHRMINGGQIINVLKRSIHSSIWVRRTGKSAAEAEYGPPESCISI